MGKITLLSCIESLLSGNSSFSTLKEVVIDGIAEKNNYFWCNRNFVVFRVFISEKPFYLKIPLRDSDRFFEFCDSVDFIKSINDDFIADMNNLKSEMCIYDSDGSANFVDITIIPRGEDILDSHIKSNIDEIMEMYCNLIYSGLVIDGFSLGMCQKFPSSFKISFIKKGKIVIGNLNNTELRQSFRNFLVNQLLNIYESINFNRTDILDSMEEFMAVDYENYLSNEFLSSIEQQNIEIADALRTKDNIKLIAHIKSLKTEFCNCVDRKVPTQSATLHLFKNNKYKIVGSMSENRVPIKELSSGKIGYADSKGEKIIDFKYTNATNFSESIAVVSNGNKYGAINSYGEIVIPFEYEDLVWDVDYNIFTCVKDNLYGLISRNNELIVEPKYEWIGLFFYSLAQFQSLETHKIGFVNTIGEEVIKPIYSDTTTFRRGYAKVKIGDTWRYIDVEGVLM